MPKIAIIAGLLLVGLGVLGYLGAGEPQTQPTNLEAEESTNAEESSATESTKKGKSVTALIPAIFGVILLICGFVAFNESLRKHAMHGAAAFGLLGFLAGAGRGAMGIGKFMSGDPSLNQRSFLFVWLMALICGFFVFACVQSFRAARRQQQEQPKTETS